MLILHNGLLSADWTEWVLHKYLHCPPKNVHLFIFQIILSEIDEFQLFLVCYILRKFDINSLYICPPYLYTVATLPWEIQKSHFQQYYSQILQIIYVISEEKDCNCCAAAYLFTYCCLLLPIICVALLYGHFLSLWWVIFRATIDAKPQPALQSHQHLEERNITFSQM